MEYSVIVLGQGIAGCSLLKKLVESGISAIGIDAQYPKAATLNNQKWRHSGAHYEFTEIRNLLQEAMRGAPDFEKPFQEGTGGRFLGTKLSSMKSWRTEYSELNSSAWQANEATGSPNARFLMEADDLVVDFASVLLGLRSQLRDVIEYATVNSIRHNHAKFELDAIRDGSSVTYSARRLVVAAGAWTKTILATSGIDIEGIVLERCGLLTVPQRIVDKITVWIDGPRITLLPFAETTIIGNTERTAIEDLDFTLSHQEKLRLTEGVREAFPNFSQSLLNQGVFHGCIKTEYRQGTFRNWHPSVLDSNVHGIENLFVVFPGKASLAWVLAEKVYSRIHGNR